MRTLIVLLALLVTACSSETLTFHDAESQTHEFIAWEQEIQLTAAQESVKKTALESIPAACCGDNSAYTCCCPCNLSRSVWGLSHHLIAEKNYSANQVREKVQEWIAFVNPEGFSGQVCYTRGGCQRSFEDGGCGGMNPNQVVF